MAKLALLLSVLLHVNLHFVTSTSINIGAEVRSRQYVDTAPHFLLLPDVDDQSTIDGMMTGIQMYTRNTKQVQISIWRPESGPNYRFIGKLDITPTVVGYNNIEIAPAEYIAVETGDVLGVMWANAGVIDFDSVSCSNNAYYRYLTTIPSSFVDQVYTFGTTSSSGPCRKYSVKAVIEEQCVVETQREIKHYPDLHKGSIIYVDYPFQCAGHVTGVQFYAENAGTFYLSAWRPNGSGDSWALLGYMAITSERRGKQTFDIPVEYQILVEASDVFGIVYPKGSARIISSKNVKKRHRDDTSSRYSRTRQTVEDLSTGMTRSVLVNGGNAERIIPVNVIIG